MRRLVITTDDSAAGCLKGALRDARVTVLMPRFLCAPIPDRPKMQEFFTKRAKLLSENPTGPNRLVQGPENEIADWYGTLAGQWSEWDAVEFWADPDPNSQLILLQFLDWIARQNTLDRAKLHLASSERCLGEIPSDGLLRRLPPMMPVSREHLDLGALAWAAFRHRTPERWVALTTENLDALPFLRATVDDLLTELPAHDSCLGRSEAEVLGLIASDDAHPETIFRHFGRKTSRKALTLFELGDLLDRLARRPDALLLGLEGGPFGEHLLGDRDRYAAYRKSRLRLSGTGRALIEGEVSLLELGRVSRWWGGVHLTSENCWRWHAAERRLLPPD